jgi:lipoprotein-releasing system permease protein
MKLPWELFLSLRYLKPKRTFVSIITVISTIGVVLSVTVLIVVMAVMSGFDRDLRDKILGFNAHLTISSFGIIRDPQRIVEKVKKVPHVTAAAPYTLGLVLLEFNDRIAAPYMKGIDPKQEEHLSKLRAYIVNPSTNAAPDKTLTDFLDGDKVIIGKEMAHEYGIFVGDKVTIYSPKNFTKKGEVTLPSEMEVTGIYEFGMYEYDVGFIFTSLKTAQDLYELGHGVHAIAAMTDEPFQVEPVKRAVNAVLDPPLHAMSWIDQNSRIFAALLVEKNVMFVILIFIIIVAAFGLCSTQITVVVQKTREIGILKALGASNFEVMLVFVAQGVVVGFLGTILGLGLGMLLLHYRNPFMNELSRLTGMELFPKELYHFNELPAQIIPGDIATICVVSFVICMLASVIPAYRAARLEPVEALRGE